MSSNWGTALSFAQSVFSTISSVRTARRQAAETTGAALQDFGAISARGRQITRKAKDEMGARAVQAQHEAGRLNAILADTNLTGNTAVRLQQEVSSAAIGDEITARRNLADEHDQQGRLIKATGAKYRSQLAGIKAPSAVEAGLKMYGANIEANNAAARRLASKVFPDARTRGDM